MTVALVCTAWDAATQTCAAASYQELVIPAVLPPLSVEEAGLLAVGIVSTWALGFFVRSARRIPETY